MIYENNLKNLNGRELFIVMSGPKMAYCIDLQTAERIYIVHNKSLLLRHTYKVVDGILTLTDRDFLTEEEKRIILDGVVKAEERKQLNDLKEGREIYITRVSIAGQYFHNCMDLITNEKFALLTDEDDLRCRKIYKMNNGKLTEVNRELTSTERQMLKYD